MSDLDKAVVAYRENPTEENRAHLMREQEKHMHEFFQREQKELA